MSKKRKKKEKINLKNHSEKYKPFGIAMPCWLKT